MSDQQLVLTPEEVETFNTTLYEFLAKHDESNLEVLFNLFDRDKNGLISPDELKAVMEQVSGHGFSDEKVQSIISSADINQDGLIDIREFVQVMKKLND